MEKRLSMPDGLRVLAIGLVMAFHIWQQSWLSPVIHLGGLRLDLSPLVRTGYLGVDAMLLLSGYLLALPQARGKQLRPVAFYRKRLIRILPCYLLCVGMYFFASALPRGEYASAGAMWKDLLTHLTFTHAFFYDTYVATHLNVVLWTLAIEMQFYLIYPLVIRCFQKNCLLTYAAMVLSALLFRRYAASGERTVMFMNQLPAMLDLYANGMLAEYLTVEFEKHEFGTPARLAFTLLSMFAFFAIYRLAVGQYADSCPLELRRAGQLSRRYLLGVFLAMALVFGESYYLLYRRIFSNPVTYFLSAISYNAYLWHTCLALKLKEWKIPNYLSENPASAGEMPWQLHYTLLCFFSALLLATALTFGFERPLTKKLTQKYEHRRCKQEKSSV